MDHYLQFIGLLQNATIDNDFIDDELKYQLRNPPRDVIDLSNDQDLVFSLETFIAISSRQSYERIRSAYGKRHPESNFSSFDRLKTKIRNLTGSFHILSLITFVHQSSIYPGVASITTHMCINSCHAFTGPFKDFEECMMCNEPRFDLAKLEASNGRKKVPRREFHMIPTGPFIQALHRCPEVTESMKHRALRTDELVREAANRGASHPETFDDMLCSTTYIEAIARGDITDNDTVLMLQIDGAQLYAHKQSDAWICILVLLDLPPELRYKKRFVIPVTVIPGPHKPKHIESFLFPTLHHLAALQNDGLKIWNCLTYKVVICRPWLFATGADAPGSAQVSRIVPPNGVLGCRYRCKKKGRRKPGKSMYYPALLRPNNYTVPECDQADIDANTVHRSSINTYHEDVVYLIQAQPGADYRERRKITGLVKPCILSGLPRTVPPPMCFPGDLMHVGSLNITELFLQIWRGTIDCDPTDDRSLWDWATLKGDAWIRHGEEVVKAAPYLPGSFGDAPRNIAEKAKSGYKAHEFKIWFYLYGPAMLYGVIPDIY